MTVIKSAFLLFFIILVHFSMSQDKVVLSNKDTLHIKIVDLNSYGLFYIDAEGKQRTISNWRLKYIEFGNQEDAVLLKRGKIKKGHVFKIDQQRIFLGISGKKNPQAVYISSTEKIVFSDGSVDSIPPFILKEELNEGYVKAKVKEAKIITEEENFEKYSALEKGKARVLVGYNLLNEAHLGIGKNLANNKSIELQLGYLFATRKNLVYDPAGGWIAYWFSLLAKRQNQQGFVSRVAYNYPGIKKKSGQKIERTFILEYSYLESNDFTVVEPTGYHSTEPGYIYNTTSNNIGLIFGQNRYISKWLVYYVNLGFSIDFERLTYIYEGTVYTDSGKPVDDGNPANSFDEIQSNRTTWLPLVRVGFNIYLSR